MADGGGQGFMGYSGQDQQAETLKAFWQSQLVEVSEVPPDPAVFKNHQLPLARIKKIMKSDEDVRMISAEAPVLFAKACEMFILELTLRSWMHAEENKRRTLQRTDVAAAIYKTDIFDFLLDVVPRDESKEEGQAAASAPAAAPPPAPPAPPAPLPAAPRPPAPAPAPMPAVPPLGPAGFFFPPPFAMPHGALGDPSQAAAAAAAAAQAAMMRPPMPPMGVDPGLFALYQQQLMAGQAWGIPGLPSPAMAQMAQMAAHVQQQQAAAVAAAAAAGAAQASAMAAGAPQGGHPPAEGQAAGTPTVGQGPQQSGEQQTSEK